MVLPLLIALSALIAGLFVFKDDISTKFLSPKSEAEKERERADAKIRDDKGAFLNTRDFLFGEGQGKIPPTPEELQVQKKIDERGAFANIQAFFFGEESLEPSLTPPNLASGPKTVENTEKDLDIQEQNIPVFNRNNVITNSRTNRPRRSTNLLEEQNKLKDIQSSKTTKGGEAFLKPVAPTIPNQNLDNIVPKNERVGQRTRKSQNVKNIVKENQPNVPDETLRETMPIERKVNIVSKPRRQNQSVFRPVPVPTSEIPLEQKENTARNG